MMFVPKLPAKKAKLRLRHTAGFTLVELIVTMAIMVFATGLVMVKYVSFNSTVLLNNLAYQIAFDLRETQSLAISVRGSGGEFRQEYGLHFDMASQNQYILFQDLALPPDYDQSVSEDGYIRYDPGEEVGDPIIVDPRFTITDICAASLNGGSESCYSNNDFPDFVTVAFARPDFDAVMYGEGIGQLRYLKIVLGTGDGTSEITRTVMVTSNGQITVQ